MFGLASTADTIDSLYFLHKPTLTPDKPKCKKCKTLLKQHFIFEEREENAGETLEILWVCPSCGASVRETTEL